MSAVFRKHLLAAFLIVPFFVPACSDDPVAEPWDDSEIRVLVYRAMYEQWSLDTLGCAALAVAQGDSLPAGMLWPEAYVPHPAVLRDALAGFVPLRVVDMSGIVLSTGSDGKQEYRTTDTDVAAVACFTNGIERFDGTHLGVKCGARLRPWSWEILAVCDLSHENGEWQVSGLDVYYRKTSGL